MDFAKIIKAKRTELNMTQSDLAEKLLISSKTISNWETGKTIPDLDRLVQVAGVLDLSLDEIFMEDSTMVKNLERVRELKETKLFINYVQITSVILLMIEIVGYELNAMKPIIIYLVCAAIFSNIWVLILLNNKYKKQSKLVKNEKKDL
ncbi:helix-turn-helix domain-containing protein [Fructilactobacillus frigidiflavus]|uniref:helix-turn-helix domain-containing protein n=1 Tax=Fructilactobacillus frigidiflavus TaxID=3242688 RepID=UPI00375753FE